MTSLHITSHVGPDLLTVRQAAEALGLSRHTVRGWIAHRRIGYIRVGRKSIRIPREEIVAKVADGYQPGVEHVVTR